MAKTMAEVLILMEIQFPLEGNELVNAQLLSKNNATTFKLKSNSETFLSTE